MIIIITLLTGLNIGLTITNALISRSIRTRDLADLTVTPLQE
jgi:hypothetical protein